jgi:hypothetical protein
VDPGVYADLGAELARKRLRGAVPHEPALARPSGAPAG